MFWRCTLSHSQSNQSAVSVILSNGFSDARVVSVIVVVVFMVLLSVVLLYYLV